MSYPVLKGGLQSSLKYTWNDADVLGKGATADVFLGRNKVNGDVVAVKQFRQTHRTGYEVEYREMQLLQKLNHENVIRLFGIEQQSVNGSIVIIMEYCEGGSLHALLDQPQNTYGLSESTFILVLKHVVKGIQYLQSLDIIHRDIKPGNIMRCFTEEGDVMFKLTDFGAARKLEEEENFTSMYGTEEYLYPAMYETAVLRLPTGQTFDSKVDLWSLGVTFYHCATGKLPFTPHGGRSNRETMFKIISQKETGVISGTQHFENGPITWSRELPRTCLLSSGLKKMLVPLLAGLMETDQHRMINHDKLYDIVTNNICSCIVVNVFHYATCTNLSIYVNSKASLSVLQDCIAEQTDIPASQQILLYMGRLVKHEIDQMVAIETYPKYLLRSTLYVFNSIYIDEIQPLHLNELPLFPEFKSTYPDYDRDCKISFQCSSRSYYIKAVIETLVNNQKCLVEGEQFLRSYVSSRTMIIDESFNGLVKVLQQSRKRFEVFYNLLKSINSFMESVFSKSPELEAIVKDKSLISVHEKAEERKSDIEKYKSVLWQKLDEMRVKAAPWVAICEENKCLASVSHYCENITSLLGRFRRDKNVRMQMTPHDEKVHGFERQKLERICMKNRSLPDNHCFSNIQIMFSQAFTYLMPLIRANGRLDKIEKNMESVIECQQLLSARLDTKIEIACELLSKLRADPRTMGKNIGTSVSNIQPTPSRGDPGYASFIGFSTKQSASPAISINPSQPANPTEINQTIAELTIDAAEMSRLVETSNEILNRFFLQDSLASDGSIGNATRDSPKADEDQF